MYKSNNNMRDFLLLNEKQKEFQTRKNEEKKNKNQNFYCPECLSYKILSYKRHKTWGKNQIDDSLIVFY